MPKRSLEKNGEEKRRKTRYYKNIVYVMMFV